MNSNPAVLTAGVTTWCDKNYLRLPHLRLWSPEDGDKRGPACVIPGRRDRESDLEARVCLALLSKQEKHFSKEMQAKK